MFSMGVSLITPASSTVAPEDTFYPPLDSISYITGGAGLSFSEKFTAPAEGPASMVSAAYDYCAMPHPHPDRYQPPLPVQNRSVEAQLVYVEYIQRHQRRTAYNILPGGEDQTYNCDNVHPYLYAEPAAGSPSSIEALAVYAQTYSDPTNPFIIDFVNGSCQYPQLTLGGILNGYQHGRDLWAVYGDSMKLLPSSPDTQKALPGLSCEGFLPNHREPLPLHQQPPGVDTVNQVISCQARSKLLAKIQSTDAWKEHLEVTRPLRARLARLFRANMTEWMSTFDHFADNFQARLCNGYRLPCSRSDPLSCVTEDEAEVFRAADWEWNYWWRQNQNASRYIQLTEGLFLKEIAERLKSTSQRTLGRVYTHSFVHDGDLGPVLGAMGIQRLRWPGMGSNMAFEVWKTNEHQFFVRVLYGGHPLRTVHGDLEWVPLPDIVTQLMVHVPDDIVSMCNDS
ncbi:histidine acid phosphatase [Penicillium cinerascens]|uniref:Histidine acid phosphatase n=1 Tax=Penicillium cinerascens TaxID=70096 RepID=A0A9W9JKI3_9EURO|nr:histidine acid phosphatase [Penicillium cinerascens]KAJ5197736.1 histidine acid phosphatase [Penicillium cinerascens]